MTSELLVVMMTPSKEGRHMEDTCIKQAINGDTIINLGDEAQAGDARGAIQEMRCHSEGIAVTLSDGSVVSLWDITEVNGEPLTVV